MLGALVISIKDRCRSSCLNGVTGMETTVQDPLSLLPISLYDQLLLNLNFQYFQSFIFVKRG